MQPPSDDSIKLMNEHLEKMQFLKQKIDRDIGYNYWKKYIASAFWSQISTPINLIITFLTAITTAQANSAGLISQSVYSELAIVSLIITTLNTFFRPHTQFAINTEFVQKWNDVGVKFEKEAYNKPIIKFYTEAELKVIQTKIVSYEKIQEEIHTIRKSEGQTTVNFLTDLIFLICYSTCIRNYKRWLDLDKKIERDTHVEILEKKKEEQTQALQQEELDSLRRVQLAQIKRNELKMLEELKISEQEAIDVELEQNEKETKQKRELLMSVMSNEEQSK